MTNNAIRPDTYNVSASFDEELNYIQMPVDRRIVQRRAVVHTTGINLK